MTSTGKIRYGEQHHWWPKSLIKSWAADDGHVQILTPKYRAKPRPPRAIAKITDAHNVIVGQPWDSSFEKDFDAADNSFPRLTSWLEALPRRPFSENERIQGLSLPADTRGVLSEALASLIVRNPTTRNQIRLIVEHNQRAFGIKGPYVDPSLIAANQRHLHQAFTRQIRGGGRFAVLVSEDGGFIFGDGFLHNFHPDSVSQTMSARCVIPLSPHITVLWTCPPSIPTYPRLVGMTLSKAEVDFFNLTIQVYSKDWIYFKGDPPVLDPSFKNGKHQIWQADDRPHWTPELGLILDAVHEYHEWDRGGQP